MRSVITFAAIAIVAGMIVPHYAAQMGNARPVPEAAVNAAPAQPPSSDPSSVEVEPDAMGHFHVEGEVDGRRLSFIIDTGASVIALTANDAEWLGIHPTPSDYTVVLSTANGTVRAAPARLGMVEVGNLVVRDVRAVVLPDGALSENLLGMSFLSQLHHYEYTDGKMVLEQ